MAIQPTYDEFEVRLALIHACDEVGSQAEFARKHGIDPSQLGRVLRGQEKLGLKISRIVGFDKVTRYVRTPMITSDSKPQNQTAVVS